MLYKSKIIDFNFDSIFLSVYDFMGFNLKYMGSLKLVKKAIFFLIASIFLCSCKPNPVNFVGSWVGMSGKGSDVKLTYYIVTSLGNESYSVKREYRYLEFDDRINKLQWRISNPRYTAAYYDKRNGVMVAGDVILELSLLGSELTDHNGVQLTILSYGTESVLMNAAEQSYITSFRQN